MTTPSPEVEAVAAEARELLAATWGDHRQWADIVQRIRDGSCAVHSDVVSLSCALAIEAITAALRSSASRDELLNENGWHLPSVNEGLRIARECNAPTVREEALEEAPDPRLNEIEQRILALEACIGSDYVAKFRNLKCPEGERGG